MAGKSEWPAATPVIDRNGKRVRFYKRVASDGPGMQERRRMLVTGLKWCRGCKAWLNVRGVRAGLCQPCNNKYTRELYAASPNFREARKAHRDRRRRGAERMPVDGAASILELFDGLCAYCPKPAQTWDHVTPVTKSGETVPGNMVPACASCNSRKHNMDIDAWLDRAPEIKAFTIEYLSFCGAIDG